MENHETVLLTVTIDERQMRFKVAKSDEAQVLAAVALLNKRIEGFRRFGSSNPMDRLSWAALDLAGEIVRTEKTLLSESSMSTLAEIEEILQAV
jgi:cell division protein ZapA (FtsZ GTPase activity inhibitor)